jgi:hypothetical protein
MLNEFSLFPGKLKLSNPDYMVIVILTHERLNKRNHEDYLLGVEKNRISMSKIKNMFVDGRQCPTMIGKPKIFIV